MKIKEKSAKRRARHLRVRKKIYGTREIPRLCVYRSLKHIYAQIIDDDDGNVLLAVSTLSTELAKKLKSKGNVEAAKEVGILTAKKAIQKKIKKVVFDKGGYTYHGRVKALADGAREGGLKF